MGHYQTKDHLNIGAPQAPHSVYFKPVIGTPMGTSFLNTPNLVHMTTISISLCCIRFPYSIVRNLKPLKNIYRACVPMIFLAGFRGSPVIAQFPFWMLWLPGRCDVWGLQSDQDWHPE